MAEDTQLENVPLAHVQELLTSAGFEVTIEAEDVLRIRDAESGFVIRSVLVDNILFNALNCATVEKSALSPDLMLKMLSADNGISTSSFQLYPQGEGRVSISLNNFCKLLEMGDDDADDILSCLEFLAVDAFAARELLGDL